MKKNIQKIITFALSAIIAFSLISCNRDNEQPAPPTNEHEEKGHDNWAKVEIIVHEGHLHGKLFHGNGLLIDVPILPKKQFITYEIDKNGYIKTTREDMRVTRDGKDENGKDKYKFYRVKKDDNAPIVVTTGEPDLNGEPRATRYAMEIIYYNSKGERMNSQFLTPEMLDIHQHFFTVKQYSNWVTGENFGDGKKFITDLYSYTYRDTDPENGMFNVTKGTKLTNDPIGLKGYFFFKKNLAKFNMTVQLRHLYVSKYNQDGTTSPANEPHKRLLTSGTTDFLKDIPFIVVGYNDGEDQFFESLAKYYNITPQKVQEYILEADQAGETEGDPINSFYM